MLVGATLAGLTTERVVVANKALCWELYGSLYRLLQVQLNSISDVQLRESVLLNNSNDATNFLYARVLDEAVAAGSALLTNLNARHVHVVLEGLHPAKETTQRERRSRPAVRPTSELVQKVQAELLSRFPEDITFHHPPHDADSQLAYLCASGASDYALVPSNDCDMALFYGMENKLILNPSWGTSSTDIEGVVYRGPDGELCKFDVAMLRCFATIVGCDYFNCRNFGPKKTHQLVKSIWDNGLHPQENCRRIQANMGSLFLPSTEWQVETLADAYSCFSNQLIVTTDGILAPIDEVCGNSSTVPAPILLSSYHALSYSTCKVKVGEDSSEIVNSVSSMTLHEELSPHCNALDIIESKTTETSKSFDQDSHKYVTPYNNSDDHCLVSCSDEAVTLKSKPGYSYNQGTLKEIDPNENQILNGGRDLNSKFTDKGSISQLSGHRPKEQREP